MGAGASNPTKIGGVTEDRRGGNEGYDSELEAETNEDYSRETSIAQGDFLRDTNGGRLSRHPAGGQAPFACAGKLVTPALWETLPTAGDVPSETLKLEFVHGYRGHDARHNLFYNTQGKLVYHAAALGIVMCTTQRKQQFFAYHEDDVLCLAAHPRMDICATASIGIVPVIHVWRSSDCVLLATLTGFHQTAVVAMSFSTDGRQLASVGMDANHSLAVYEWDANKHANTGVCAGRLIASTKCDTNRIFCCAYSPDGRVVTGGELHLKFHTLDLAAEGHPALIGIPAEYAHRARHGFKESTVLCVCFNPEGAAFVGTKGGDVYKFEEEGTRAVKKFPVVHQGPVSEILFSANGNFIVTGGKDGKVKFHNAFMHHQFEISLSKVAEAIVDEHYNPVCYAASGSRTPYVRAVCQNAGGTKIAVGISCSEVYEFDVSSPGAYTLEAGRALLVQGHAASIDAKSGAAPTMTGEVWGLDPHPFKPVFATCSDDKSVRLWSTTSHRLVSLRRLKNRARCVSWHPKGKLLAVGCLNGLVLVLDMDAGTVNTSFTLDSAVRQVRYSPLGKFLAVGIGKMVKIFDTLKGIGGQYTEVEDATGMTGDVLHFDWSADGRFLRVNCAAGGLYKFSMPDGELAASGPGAEASEAEWASQSCIASWATQGVWPEGARCEDVNRCALSNRGDWRQGEKSMVTVDDFGKVKLFHFPADVGRAKFREYKGHSAHATNCAFVFNDKYVITLGGADRCVFQWRHLEENEAEDSDDEEDGKLHDQGKGSRAVLMVQTGMTMGEAEFEPLNASEGVPNPYKNHSLAELKAKRGYKAPIVGRPVMGQMRVPSNFKVSIKETYEACKQRLKIDWVNGYRGWDTHQNLFYTQGHRVAFHCAAFGVVYDRASNTQAFVTDNPESEGVAEGNTDDTLCMARHPNKSIFATGEIGLRPKIVIWDSADMEGTKSPPIILEGFHQRAVVALCFSANEGAYLASVGKDNDHSVAIYDWRKEELLATYSGDQNPVLCIACTISALNGFWRIGVHCCCDWSGHHTTTQL